MYGLLFIDVVREGREGKKAEAVWISQFVVGVCGGLARSIAHLSICLSISRTSTSSDIIITIFHRRRLGNRYFHAKCSLQMTVRLVPCWKEITGVAKAAFPLSRATNY